MSDTSIGLSREVKNRLEPVKDEHDASSWDEFMDDLVAENLNIAPEDLDEYTVEQHERVEQTRATIVGVLEALDEADMVDEVVEIITALSQQGMLAQNQEIVEHLIDKAKGDGEINEGDRLLARMVIETEGARNHESPAAEIARGLFAETDTATAERTTTERQRTSENTGLEESESPQQQDDMVGSDSEDIGFSIEKTDEEL
jgi:hypothetical protein